jgi:hypothetical protein
LAYTDTVGIVASVAEGPMNPPSLVTRRMSAAAVDADGAGVAVGPWLGTGLGGAPVAPGDGAGTVLQAAARSATIGTSAGRPIEERAERITGSPSCGTLDREDDDARSPVPVGRFGPLTAQRLRISP